MPQEAPSQDMAVAGSGRMRLSRSLRTAPSALSCFDFPGYMNKKKGKTESRARSGNYEQEDYGVPYCSCYKGSLHACVHVFETVYAKHVNVQEYGSM